MKKILTSFLALVIGTGIIIASNTSVDGIWYNFNSSTLTAEVTYRGSSYSSYSNEYSGSVVIPSSVTYSNKSYSVTSIGYSAFRDCTGLTSIEIPNSVTSIQMHAFSGCTGLTSIEIPNSVTRIGWYVFYGCTRLISVTIGNSVTSIEMHAFSGCTGLTSVTIPNSVTSIESFAFSGCTGLTSITIPNSVTSIGQSVFSGCTSLTTMTVAAGNTVYDSRDNCNAIIGTATNTLEAGCQNTTIPNSVTGIGWEAFNNCTSLTSVTIPNSVTSIGYYAFSGCTGLTSITIPNSVTSIGQSVFSGCTGLTSMTVAAGNTVYDSRDNCNAIIETATNTLEAGCQNTTIPNSVTSIGSYAFFICTSLTSVTIPNSVTSIGMGAFGYCTGLSTIDFLNENPPTLGEDALPNSINAIYVPCGSLATYTNNWTDYSSIIQYKPFPYSVQIQFDSIAGAVSNTPMNTICDTILTITATPNYGYHFVQWSDSVTDNPRTIYLKQDTTFTAAFRLNQYSINVTCDEALGYIEGENGVFDYLTEKTYEATPNYGYHFVRWSDGNTDNPRTITITEDIAINAVFVKNRYTIFDYSDHTQGYIYGSGLHAYLDEITLYPVNEYGYHFTQWSDGNTDNPRTIILTQDTTFTAEFAIDKSGTCGESNALTWSYEDQSQTLTITGNGALTDNYTFGFEAPTLMNILIIGDGVTAIGDSAFSGMATINHLTIGGNVASIGDYAFAECRNFDDITCYAYTVPTITANTFANVGNKQYIYLFVPEGRQRAYLRDQYWGEFDVQVKGADPVTTGEDVTVIPSDNSAAIIWPSVDDAATYEIEITRDGVVVCTLTFNSQGYLTGIAFIPGRDAAAYTQQTQTTGFSFTVTGLNSNTLYGYTVAAKDGTNTTLDTKSGSFETTGGVVTELESDESHTAPQKIYRNGNVYILRDGKTYTIQGQEVKLE